LKSFQYINIITFAVKAFFILLLLTMVILLGLLFYYSYEEFTSLLINLYGKMDKLEVFRSNFLTLSTFKFLKYTIGTCILLSLVILYKLNFIAYLIGSKIYSFLYSIISFGYYLKESYHKLTKYEKWIFNLVILIISIVKLYYLSKFPFHIDEVASYLFFVKRGIFVAASYFPAPNNHIFYSVITCFFQPFIKDPFYLMKIPSWILSSVTSAILFLFLLRSFNFSISILGTLLFSFMQNYFVYSVSGRGYALMTSFTLISFIATFEIISGNKNKYLWHIYFISAVLGFYTLFTFLYPLVSFSLAIVIYVLHKKEYSLIKPFVYYNVLIGGAVLLLYLPVFIISGFSALASNPWMIKLDWPTYFSKLPKLINGAFEFILGIENFQVVAGMSIIIVAVAILYKTKRKEWFWLILTFFIIPPILLTIQRLQPYHRVWIYLIFPMSICLLIIFDWLISFFKNNKYAKNFFAGAISISILVYTLIRFNEMTGHGYLMYDNVSRITSYIVQQENVKVYTNDDSYNLFLRYESSQIGRNVVPQMESLPAPMEFDYVLLTKSAVFPATINADNYALKEKDDYIVVYKHK
jgi:hypothetical protein